MLSDYLSTNIYQFMMVFIRISAALMAMPGIGGTLVQARARLWIGMSFAFVMMPMVVKTLPPLPHQPAELFLLILGEIVIGAFLGAVTHILMTSVDVAGSFIGFQTGLTNAFSFDAISQQQSQLLTGFLNSLALTVVFSSDLHHQMLQAITQSYDVFPPGTPLMLGDFATSLAHLATHAFEIGIRMAAPVLVFGLVFQSGMGLLSRLVPQMQIYFVAMPIQLLLGMWMLMVALPLMMLLFTTDFAQGLGPFLK
jgi:flagellar biosynthesis protein FliR